MINFWEKISVIHYLITINKYDNLFGEIPLGEKLFRWFILSF